MSKVGFVAAVILAVGTGCAAGTAANAAEPARPLLWSGPYAGAYIGAGRQRADTGYSAVPTGPFSGIVSGALADGAIPASTSQDESGLIGGGALGYNFRSGSLVYGFEIDATWLGLRETSSTTTSLPGYPVMETRTTTETDWLATLRARAGTLVTPQTLLFVTGGLAAGGVKGTTNVTPDPCDLNAFCSKGSGSDTLWGWTAGVGVEHAVGTNWSVKIEYLHYDLGSFSYTSNEAAASFPQHQGKPNLKVDTDVTGQILRAGVNFKF